MSFANEILIGSTSNAWTAPTITQGIPMDLQLTLTDASGAVVDLTAYAASVAGDGGSYGIVPVLPVTEGVVAVITEFLGQTTPLATIVCSVANGDVVVPIQKDLFRNPGLFYVTFLLITGSTPKQAIRTQLAVEPNYSIKSDTYPLTIGEVRMWMRDNTADDNFLLDEVEFKDREVIAAIRGAVDIWNGTPPLLERYKYDVNTFPDEFRQQWISMAVGLLKSMAADNYFRNHLPYSAGGVSFDERAKYQQYKQDAMAASAEYKQWVVMIKAQLNREQCYTIINFRGSRPS